MRISKPKLEGQKANSMTPQLGRLTFQVKSLVKEIKTNTNSMDMNQTTNKYVLPDSPQASIFFRFLASRMQTVSLPAVGTYRREMQISPSFSG